MGADSGGQLLSTALFENATFYLDTNVVIPALEQSHKHASAFKAIAQACQQFSSNFKVAEITVSELTNWVHYQRTLVTKVLAQIPDNT